MKKALVLGMARSGIAVAKLLQIRGYDVYVCDSKKKEDFKGALDELEKNGVVNVRIDYKDSGVGSNSCGPDLLEKYRLDEKEIQFGFSVK